MKPVCTTITVANHVADTTSTREAFRRSTDISDIKQTIQRVWHAIMVTNKNMEYNKYLRDNKFSTFLVYIIRYQKNWKELRNEKHKLYGIVYITKPHYYRPHTRNSTWSNFSTMKSTFNCCIIFSQPINFTKVSDPIFSFTTISERQDLSTYYTNAEINTTLLGTHLYLLPSTCYRLTYVPPTNSSLPFISSVVLQITVFLNR
jgi:hypothetical protein